MHRLFALGLAAALNVAFLAAGALPARAADIPTKAPPVYPAPQLPFNWGGFYFGINGGVAGGRSNWTDPAAGDAGGFRLRGGGAGGQFGYNWQGGPWVLGLESDIDWMSLKGSSGTVGGVCAVDGGASCSTQQNWLGTTRGRIGYAFDRWLPFVTAGAAYGDVQANQASGSSDKTKLGWTAGGGLEYGITKNLSAKLEFLHIDLGTATFMGAGSGQTLSVPAKDNMVRAGVNYRFSW